MIRAATPEDAPALATILSDWIAETQWMPKLHSREWNQKFVTRLIGSIDVTVAGATQGFLARKGDEIDALYVASTARGRGLGTALLRHAQSAADHLELWTFQANTGAIRFYERHGFTEARRTNGADNEEKLPDIRFVWHRNEAPKGHST